MKNQVQEDTNDTIRFNFLLFKGYRWGLTFTKTSLILQGSPQPGSEDTCKTLGKGKEKKNSLLFDKKNVTQHFIIRSWQCVS